MGHCTETSEEGLVGDLLEVTLTDVLKRKAIREERGKRHAIEERLKIHVVTCK